MLSPPDARARAAGIALGVLADAVLADPRRGHPVALYGSAVARLERVLYAPSRLRGVAFTAAAVAGPVVAGVLAERLTGRVDARPVAGVVAERVATRSWARVLVTAVATWTALGGTSLAREGAAMARSLEDGDLPSSRDRLRNLCARDPADLGAAELARATVESLAENTSDAVVAPLVWAGIAGVPGVLGYRAVNTLDAMIGYRSDRYLRFGWASARLDDLVNLLPARLTGAVTVACAPLVGGSVATTGRVLLRDARHHPSPNAGWCEAGAAGALGVRLGGANVYGGRAETRPVLGEGGREPAVADVRRAVRLERAVSAVSAGVVVGVLVAGRFVRARSGSSRLVAERRGLLRRREFGW